MATIAGPGRVSSRAERAFYLAMALVLLVFVGWGFSASFYLRPFGASVPPTSLDGTGPGWWLFVAHGGVFTAWLLLFVAQTALVGSRQLRLHRAIGRNAYWLYALVVATGLLVTFYGARYGFHIPGLDRQTFAAVPFFTILAFAILAWSGLAERSDVQRHKRLMLLAMIALSDAGLGRIAFFRLFMADWLPATVLMLVPLLLWDLATRGRPHRTTLSAGLLVAAVLILAIPIGMTAPWHALVNAVTG